ncbi:MAG: YwiC-like family protein, partial [Actinomycetota bacterium]
MSSTATPRSALRSVAMPTEHGGWGLTLEPGVLGLVVEPSAAGLLLALAAFGLFLVRTPLELALVDRWRRRRLDRTALAERVAGGEAAVLMVLVAGAALLADGNRWWVPVLVAAPLVGVQLAYDIRSRRRRLVPELTGAMAIAGVVAAIVLAGGGSNGLAAALWLLLAGRAMTSIPHVRAQIARSHDRACSPRLLLATDGMAVALGALAVAVDDRLVGGAVALAALVAFQWVRRYQPVAPVKIIGISQMVLGLVVVVWAVA